MPLINLHGQRFGRLTVISRDPSNTKKWICDCDCGNKTSVFSRPLRVAGTRSCGCLFKESCKDNKNKSRKHGLSRTREYGVWRSMIQRCIDKDCKSYARYGHRGISVCDRWLNSFEHFLVDMGIKPFPSAEIDRIDNNGNYEPTNCQWTTRSVNRMNRRDSRRSHELE